MTARSHTRNYTTLTDAIGAATGGRPLYSEIPGFYAPERAHRINIARVVHVMPKTFVGHTAFDLVDGSIVGFAKRAQRMWRNHVIACVATLDAAIALRCELMRIGTEADRLIEVETQASEELQGLKRRVDEIEGEISQRVRSAAAESVRRSLPELFKTKRRSAA